MNVIMLATVLVAAPPPVVHVPAQGAPAVMPAGPARRMVTTGVALTALSVGAYAVMAAGLGISREAEDRLRVLKGREDLQRRREAFARGQLGNRLAIAGGVSAAVLMTTGIALVVTGRARGRPTSLSLLPGPRGLAATWRVRF